MCCACSFLQSGGLVCLATLAGSCLPSGGSWRPGIPSLSRHGLQLRIMQDCSPLNKSPNMEHVVSWWMDTFSWMNPFLCWIQFYLNSIYCWFDIDLTSWHIKKCSNNSIHKNLYNKTRHSYIFSLMGWNCLWTLMGGQEVLKAKKIDFFFSKFFFSNIFFSTGNAEPFS